MDPKCIVSFKRMQTMVEPTEMGTRSILLAVASLALALTGYLLT